MTRNYTATKSCWIYTDGEFKSSMSFLTTWSHLFNNGFWVGVVGTSFFTGFRVLIYCWMIKISKGVGISKWGSIKYQWGRGGYMFFRPGELVYHCWSLVLKHISVFVCKFTFQNDKCYYLLFYSFPFSLLKLVSATFYQIFIFSQNDSPLKTMKNVFYFI